jgi:hypothetical protein
VKKRAKEQTSIRWVFGEYIVYCSDPHTAQRIYEVALNRPNREVHFGVIRLEDGRIGNWVVMPSRTKRGTEPATVLPGTHS